jgi:hypothetical protein
VQESVPLPKPVADVDEAEHVVGHALKADAFGGILALPTHFIFCKDVALLRILAFCRPFLAAKAALAREDRVSRLMHQKPV